jgi:hypothetical protein
MSNTTKLITKVRLIEKHPVLRSSDSLQPKLLRHAVRVDLSQRRLIWVKTENLILSHLGSKRITPGCQRIAANRTVLGSEEPFTEMGSAIM